jgi:hypothetical protein
MSKLNRRGVLAAGVAASFVPAALRAQAWPSKPIRWVVPYTAGGLTDVGATLHRAAEMVKRRGLIILISDLLDEPARVLAGLKHFRHRGHEVLVFHVLDPLERDLDLRREVRLEDLETGETLRTQPWFIREEAGARVAAWIRGLESECREHRIDYAPLTTDTPFEVALRRLLDRRARQH